jgi:tRNA dimethylallyltransferase
MLSAGLIEEVHALRSKYQLQAGLPSMRCVGYRQVWEMIEGRLPAGELRDRGIFATRQFAKRQLTWFNSFPEIEVLDCQKPGLAATIQPMIERFFDQ